MLVSRIALLATAVAAAVVKRDAAQVLADLKVVQSDNQKLQTAIANYNGGGLGPAIPILNAAKQLDNDIKTTTSDSDAAGNVSETDAQSILDYITNTIEPTIASTMNTLHQKKATADANGLTSIVHDQLVTIKGDTDKLGASLKAHAPADKQAAATAILTKIDADFQKEIDEYSS